MVLAMMVLMVGLGSPEPKVLTGIDVLERTEFRELKPDARRPRRIAVLTNQNGITWDGRRTIDVFHAAAGVKLVAIFSPEHGLAGKEDREGIADAVDDATKLPVYSLYGHGTKGRRPRADVLKQVDAVVVDLQDVGARFYTYASSVGYLMEEAAKVGVEVVVLDRPNPINGVDVQGPMSDAESASFVNYHPLPVRHGMTLGELAQLFNAEKRIRARLTVVKMRGWTRDMWFDETGLPWANPSPAITSLAAATLYPGLALLEHTNVSVGRGTDMPFEVIGAPWIDGEELAQWLRKRGSAVGVKFEVVTFTPASSTHKAAECQGVRITVLDRKKLNPPVLGLDMADALRTLYPSKFQAEKMKALVANAAILQKYSTGEKRSDAWEEQARRVIDFAQSRKRHLIY